MLPLRMQQALSEDRVVQPFLESVVIPQWVEHVQRIHDEVRRHWITEIDPSLEARMHRDLDADFAQALRTAPGSRRALELGMHRL